MLLVSLISCSSSPQTVQVEQKLYLLIEYTGARYDLNAEAPNGSWKKLEEVKVSLPNTTHVIQNNMSYMVVCNDRKSDCKHAAVASSITYKIDSNQLVSGNFNTEVGQKVTISDNLGSLTRSVPDGVGVALTTKKSIPFSIQAKKDQVKIITGPSGDKIKITIVDKI